MMTYRAVNSDESAEGEPGESDEGGDESEDDRLRPLLKASPPPLPSATCVVRIIDLFENSFWQASFRGIVQAMPHKYSPIGFPCRAL